MVVTSPPTVVIGLDPGYDRLGWAVAYWQQRLRVIDHGCITTNKKQSLAERYLDMLQQLESVLTTHKPQVAVIEALFFSKNQTTALKVAEARGVVLAALARNKLKIVEYSPNQVKLAVTGYGNADKVAMQKMIQLQVVLPDGPSALIKKGESKKILDDTFDAMGLALTYLSDARARSGSV